jgi:uncharacterized protein with GYD domain
MPHFIILMKLTEQGAKAVKSAPERIEAGIKAMEALGGKSLGFYSTLGEYDYISFGEAPSDEIAAVFCLGLASQGFVKTTTLRAFSKEEFAGMVKKLP